MFEWYHPPPDPGQWAEEFADLTSADTAALQEGRAREGYRQDFWKSLEDEWKEAADADHPWLNDYKATYEPFQQYAFREDNPLEETQDPLEEGKRRLEAVGDTRHPSYDATQGDLPSAVLLFEAAAQKTPDSPEVWQLLGGYTSYSIQYPVSSIQYPVTRPEFVYWARWEHTYPSLLLQHLTSPGF